MLKIKLLIGIIFLSSGFYCLAQGDETPTRKAEQIRVGTWNVENFMKMFDQDRMPQRSRNQTELWRDEEDQYEVARVIKDPAFNPDILVIQECCDEPMLNYFNRKWLDDSYTYVKTFQTNSDGQYLGILAKKGFEPMEVKEYYQDQDPIEDRRISYAKQSYNKEGENKLFCRGPGFVLFKTPRGNQVWVGTTHSKSKSGNNKAVTEWRIREFERTRQICGQLMDLGKTEYLVILGDFNDDFGMDAYEQSLGTDAIETMIKGTGSEKLICLDRTIWTNDPNAASYHCVIKPPKYRSFLDHAFASPQLGAYLEEIVMIQESIAYVASDHLPIICLFNLPTQ